MKPADLAERNAAQDLTYSCVVRAPAGSGKTELLVQRALRALLVVESPEQVLILTFTNKAVQELRHRMIAWICQSEGEKQGLKETAELAIQVRQRSVQQGWDLHLCPQRLQVFTLDAYFSYLYQRFNQDKNGQHCELLSDPKLFYEEILDETLEKLFIDSEESLELLHIFNGSVSSLRQLFLQLTLTRDRWLSALYNDTDALHPQDYLLHECGILQTLTEDVSVERDSAAAFLSQYDQSWPYSLAPNTAQYWRCWANVLLTEKGTWRQSFRKDQGVPAKDQLHSWHDASERAQVLAYLGTISETLQQNKIAHALLRLLRSCPDNHTHELPPALAFVLKKWVALLSVMKNERRVMDFIDLTMEVASFFHTPEIAAPLEAFIDKNVAHLLIDEIQDLSRLQFEIIRALLQNFCYRPEKSAFMVGDPQQAIYHFRGAHIGVFGDFESLELEGLPKKNCLLQSNFRSSQDLVGFVNSWAQQRFGCHSSAWLGIDRALQSIAMIETSSTIECLSSECPQTEAAALLAHISQLQQQSPDSSIAVLARDRSSLAPLINLLNYYHISYDAEDMLSLSQYAFFTDLSAIIRIILAPETRANWLIFLRSTWLRASYDDITRFYREELTDFWSLKVIDDYSLEFQQDYQRWVELSARLEPFKGRSPFARFWDCVWQNMRLSEILSGKEFQIWQQVSSFLRSQSWEKKFTELIAELSLFVDKVPLSKHSGVLTSNLKLLTIHKAKGLEFDTVILPNLAARLPTHERPFLLEVPIGDNLFWALKDERHQQWFDFFDDLLKQQQDHEFERLLYVALTRAKKRLVLSYNEKKFHARSFLTTLKDFLPDPRAMTQMILDPPLKNLAKKKIIRSWPAWFWQKFYWNSDPLSWEQAPLSQEQERVIGLVLHHCLSFFQTKPFRMQYLNKEVLERLWYRFGGSFHDWNTAFPQIGRGLAIIEKSVVLEEVFSPEHQEIFSEFPLITLSKRVAHQCRHLSIDRLILDKNGRYWIVEWKTGSAWKSQWSQYRAQLMNYAQAITAALGCAEPKVSLYILKSDALYTYDKASDIPLELNESSMKN